MEIWSLPTAATDQVKLPITSRARIVHILQGCDIGGHTVKGSHHELQMDRGINVFAVDHELDRINLAGIPDFQLGFGIGVSGGMRCIRASF